MLLLSCLDERIANVPLQGPFFDSVLTSDGSSARFLSFSICHWRGYHTQASEILTLPGLMDLQSAIVCRQSQLHAFVIGEVVIRAWWPAIVGLAFLLQLAIGRAEVDVVFEFHGGLGVRYDVPFQPPLVDVVFAGNGIDEGVLLQLWMTRMSSSGTLVSKAEGITDLTGFVSLQLQIVGLQG